ncbi:MAG: hypothetical protein A4E66_02438 [Syntrophus sp. PtaB.Bin001]|nr:MAG: hypothetical protein A4E66_02438 [Syntrophus sp. PtaB.Bin001]
MIKDHQGGGYHPHLFHPEKKQGLGNRCDLPRQASIESGIDDFQQLVGEGKVLQDDLGQVTCRRAVDGAQRRKLGVDFDHIVGEGRQITLVVHAPHKKLDCGVNGLGFFVMLRRV